MSVGVPVHYPASDVMVNNFDIRDAKQLQLVERVVTDASLAKLELTPMHGDFSLRHLQDIHRAIFGPIYPWAGQLRDHGLMKKGSVFDRTETFEATFTSIGDYLARRNHFRGMRKEPFAEGMGFVYRKMNNAHPFREGNGRSTRYFLDLLARQAGYEIDYAKVSNEKWNLAAIASFNGQGEPMRRIFSAVATPIRAVLFDIAPREHALAAAPELAPAFLALDRIESRLSVFTSVEREKVYAAARRAISGRLHAGYTVSLDEPKHAKWNRPVVLGQVQANRAMGLR